MMVWMEDGAIVLLMDADVMMLWMDEDVMILWKKKAQRFRRNFELSVRSAGPSLGDRSVHHPAKIGRMGVGVGVVRVANFGANIEQPSIGQELRSMLHPSLQSVKFAHRAAYISSTIYRPLLQPLRLPGVSNVVSRLMVLRGGFSAQPRIFSIGCS